MRLRPVLEWAAFAAVSIAVWAAAALYLFIAGGAACEVSGTCALDRVVALGALFILPAQAAAAVWLRSRHLAN